MRPRKRLLLIDLNETRRGQLGLVLDVRGFAVDAVDHAAAGYTSTSAPDRHYDLVIAQAPIDPMECKRIREILPHTPLFVICPIAQISLDWHPSVSAVLSDTISRAELLERVKVAVKRSRGPSRGSLRPPTTLSVPVACF